MNKNIPVAYEPKKAEKKKINFKKLYQIDSLSFDTRIGFITNLSTTMYEMQSQYAKDSREYKELDIRLKLCCKEQSAEIDKTKGLEVSGFPKHWIRETKITEEMLEKLSAEEIDEIKFNNKLAVGKKRPYFMRYLYPYKNIEYKNYLNELNIYSITFFGKKFNELTNSDKEMYNYAQLCIFMQNNNPLLETQGTMNRICYHLEDELASLKKETAKNKDCEEMFEILYNTNIDTEMLLLPLLVAKYNNYLRFKKEKQLKDSSFNTYEQYFKALRNECLQEISNNIQELANLAVWLCYKVNPTKGKDFAWDIFGSGILKNLMGESCEVEIPQKSQFGDIEYLGSKYTKNKLKLKNGEIDLEEMFKFDDFEDTFNGLDDLFDYEFDDLGDLE